MYVILYIIVNLVYVGTLHMLEQRILNKRYSDIQEKEYFL